MKPAINILQALRESNKLPLGHYGRDIARENVEKEYGNCKLKEKELWKRFMKKRKISRLVSDQETAQKICDIICDSVGLRRCRVVTNYNLPECVGGQYSSVGRKILLGSYISLSTLLHELAHHFVAYGGTRCVGGDHGETFCYMLDMVYESYSVTI